MSPERNTFNIKAEYAELAAELEAVEYNDYTSLCNSENNGSRSRGILSEEFYNEIIKDADTRFVSFGDRKVPVLIGLKYSLSMGYDTDKCKDYASPLSDNVKILSLPIQELAFEQQMQFIEIVKDEGAFALYFSDHNNDEISFLNDIFDKSDIQFGNIPLVDPRVKAEADKQASLCLYATSLDQREPVGGYNKITLSDVFSFYNMNKHELERNDEKTITKLFMGDQITDEQAEELWAVYDDKFNFLGESHPISMQDTKEDFFGLLRSKNTLLASTYIHNENNEELACFTYFTDDIESLYWLNKNYLDDKFSNHFSTRTDATNIFTPGLVSSAKGSSFSLLPLGLFSRSCDRAGLRANVLYENTNLSKQVVPWLVDKAMSSSCKEGILTKSTMIDKVSYNLWSIEP